jgi:hypothetical protein
MSGRIVSSDFPPGPGGIGIAKFNGEQKFDSARCCSILGSCFEALDREWILSASSGAWLTSGLS